MSEDYLFKAADTVMRKSMGALQVLTNKETAAKLHAVGLSDREPDEPLDPALMWETERAMNMAVEALEELANSDKWENERYG